MHILLKDSYSANSLLGYPSKNGSCIASTNALKDEYEMQLGVQY